MRDVELQQAASYGFREGDMLAGKYRVERVLGAGGMGVVLAAYYPKLDVRVAIKLMHAASLKEPRAVARFEREARAAVKIHSEHVARVMDVGQLDDGAPYIVMEYLDGKDLGSLVEDEGPLSVEQAVEFILQASEAVAEAHSLGIVHRDIKPANLFCIRPPDGMPAVKVLDFGISRIETAPSGTAGMTGTSDFLGSPWYMSPEQIEAPTTVDLRTDIWAIGVTLFELLSGDFPFDGKDPRSLMIQIARDEPRSLRSMRPDIPEALEEIIQRCMQKTPAHRYANLAELTAALGPFGPSRAQSSVQRVARVTYGQAPPRLSSPPARPVDSALAATYAAHETPDPAPERLRTAPETVPIETVREDDMARTLTVVAGSEPPTAASAAPADVPAPSDPRGTTAGLSSGLAAASLVATTSPARRKGVAFIAALATAIVIGGGMALFVGVAPSAQSPLGSPAPLMSSGVPKDVPVEPVVPNVAERVARQEADARSAAPVRTAPPVDSAPAPKGTKASTPPHRSTPAKANIAPSPPQPDDPYAPPKKPLDTKGLQF